MLCGCSAGVGKPGGCCDPTRQLLYPPRLTPPPDSGYLVLILEIPLCLTCLPSCHHTPSGAPDLRSAFPRHSASPGSSSPPSQTLQVPNCNVTVPHSAPFRFSGLVPSP
ncbi:uncharacterized protein LOC143414724 [Maylandia zebra]|uniref:uncharacterized protein LOC143414724 n=1 Tax=Maylandia zebra TaxID=106582 RepID=UPI00403D410E